MATPEILALPDWEALSDADAESIFSGKIASMDWLRAHSGIGSADPLPPKEKEAAKEADAEESGSDVEWKGPVPVFRDPKDGRVYVDEGWLRKQKWQALVDIARSAGSPLPVFNKSMGKEALVAHIVSLCGSLPPEPMPRDTAAEEILR